MIINETFHNAAIWVRIHIITSNGLIMPKFKSIISNVHTSIHLDHINTNHNYHIYKISKFNKIDVRVFKILCMIMDALGVDLSKEGRCWWWGG